MASIQAQFPFSVQNQENAALPNAKASARFLSKAALLRTLWITATFASALLCCIVVLTRGAD